MTSTERVAPPVNEVSRAARGGALTFVGAVTSAAFGFGFSVLLARLLGAGDAGIVLQTIAITSIGAAFARVGTDTTAVWLLPRLRTEQPDAVLPAVRMLLFTAAAGALVMLGAWFAVLRHLWPDGTGGRAVVEAVDLVALSLPAGVLMVVGLACTRAFGRIVVFNVVDNLTVPVLRPALLVVVHLAGGGAAAVALAWALPWWVGVTIVAGVLLGCLAPSRGRAPLSDDARRDLRSRITAYTGPRALAQALEQSIIWIDVLLVGVIAGAAAAGVYGSAARFVAAGVVVATAMRIVVAPRFSALLARGAVDEVSDLYRVTARWILLFGAPVYLSLAAFAPTLLGWLGDGFASGHGAMVVLCLGSVVLLAAGNVQALLLMSGGSAAGAMIKLVVLVVNCVGNVLLVPHHGITAAAWVWSASMVLDTALASLWVRRLTGVALDWFGVLRLGVGVLLAVGGPLWLVSAWLGQGEGPLALGIGAGALGMALLCWAERRTLRLGELRSVVRR